MKQKYENVLVFKVAVLDEDLAVMQGVFPRKSDEEIIYDLMGICPILVHKIA